MPDTTSLEQQRLAKLHSYRVLDSDADKRLSRLTKLVAQLFFAPIAFIGFVDAERVQIKARFGLDVEEMDIRDALCARSITQSGAWELSDDGTDVWESMRQRSGALRNMRFYAGAPLRTDDGFVLGALCIMDTKPRRLRPSDRRALESIAALVVEELEEHKAQTLSDTEVEVLKSSERHFRELLDTAPVLVWMTEPGDRAVFFNQNWIDFTGRNLVDELEFGWRDGVHPDDLQRTNAVNAAGHENKSMYSNEYRLLHHSGSYHWVFDVARPRYDDAGVYCGHVGGVVDITELKTVEARLEERTRELEHSNAALEQFAAVAAHDLKAPLRHIAGYAGLLQQDLGDRIGPTGREYAEHIVQAVDRMQVMVTSLLELARIPLTSEQSRFACFPLEEAVAEAHRNVGVARLRLQYEALPNVYGAQVLIVQLLQNLFDNAIKFSGNPEPKVVLATRVDHADTIISVTNDGAGVPAKYADIMFQMFKRLDPAGGTAGTGMGLTICARIAELHGGRIWLDTEYKAGTRINFALPGAPGRGR